MTLTLRSLLLLCTTVQVLPVLHAQDGLPDLTFTPQLNGYVEHIALQADGRILIVGDFTEVNGTVQNHIARLHADGTLDATFNTGSAFGAVAVINSVSVTANGQVLVGGLFTAYDGVPASGLVRLQQDGTLDTGFDPDFQTSDRVTVVEPMPNGQCYVAGTFTTIGGVDAPRLARLMGDGSLDPTFAIGDGPQGPLPVIQAMELRPTGELLIVGAFQTFDQTTASCIVQLLPSGAVDPDFNVGTGLTGGYYLQAWDIALGPTGQLYVVGDFSLYNGQTIGHIVRLNADGTRDLDFPGDIYPGDGPVIAGPLPITACTRQADGRLVVGGWFGALAGEPRARLARLDLNGAVDPAFDPGLGPRTPANSLDLSCPRTLVAQDDGTLLVGGDFTHYNGQPQGYLAKVQAANATGINTHEAPRFTVTADGRSMYINSNERIRSITLHDAGGRLVRSTSGLMQLTIADLVAGAYLVTVHTHAGTRSTARWVKTNE
ncbi:MAG: delta-60 repeat domain-containing protein [Flavobacteriales bacterium]